ncbi:zwei Ig domain protein zig-8-like isoform X3 [Tachypleus tridentatus]|uniref:zwei Ig domain protein zig-8-like isoform X3 n=1 Tax=Tachypleus tridentatus TaxID=6853 RepID=UPI003FD08341
MGLSLLLIRQIRFCCMEERVMNQPVNVFLYCHLLITPTSSTNLTSVTIAPQTSLLLLAKQHTCDAKSLTWEIRWKQVSWVRLHDLHLLTTGQYTYSNDQRLSVIYKPMSWDWTLQIQFVHQRDKGDYECQINTDPSIGRMVHLNVIAPVQKYKRKSYDWETPMKDATVSEFKGPSIHIQAGESITITCFMDGGSPGQWYHGGSLVNERAVITYSKSQNGNILSKLHIARASSEDSGSYSCGSRSPKTARVTVYVVNKSPTLSKICSFALQSKHTYYKITFLYIHESSIWLN